MTTKYAEHQLSNAAAEFAYIDGYGHAHCDSASYNLVVWVYALVA